MNARLEAGVGSLTRRALLMLGLAAFLPGRASAKQSAKPPEKLRPQLGDRLVFAFGEQAGEVIGPSQVLQDAKPVFAFPSDPETGVVRRGSRLNQVLLVRLDPATLDAKTARTAVSGIVAYSAVCTHTGCDVSEWRAAERLLMCPCHSSEFEPSKAAKVVKGPAPKPLAMLPLEIDDGGELRVGGSFTRRVGFQRP